MRHSKHVAGAFLAIALLALTASAADAEDLLVEVTITNLTAGQILSAPLVVSHNEAIGLFELGQPASDELAQLAEDAVADPLIALLEDSPDVLDVELAIDGIGPGGTMSVQVMVSEEYRQLSVAGMLVTTNDAFYAAERTIVPDPDGLAYFALAYDSGSEANTEDCAHIPGPPCDTPLVRVTEGAEGFVHIHRGIHNVGSLGSDEFDWRNPVAYVTVRPVD